MRSSLTRCALNEWTRVCREAVVPTAAIGTSHCSATTVRVAWASGGHGGGATTAGHEPLEQDPRTNKPQQRAHETDEATKESIRHAAEGELGSAVSDVGNMAKNATKGAKESAKLMYDSVKERMTGGQSNVKDDLKKD